MANTYTLTAIGRRTGEVVGAKSVTAATLKRAEELAEQWENWFRALGMYSVLVTVRKGRV